VLLAAGAGTLEELVGVACDFLAIPKNFPTDAKRDLLGFFPPLAAISSRSF